MADPNKTSLDYDAMYPFWEQVATILDGLFALKAQGEKYLPKFVKETDKNYNHRKKKAKFTNLYWDIVEGLASKPFQKEAQIREGSASDLIAGVKKQDAAGKDYRSGGFIEDVDGEGNHLHVFLAHTFFMGISNAIDWILVDKMPVPEGSTLADEKRLGARPYWVHINALDVLAVYRDRINGKDEFIHARIREWGTIRNGFEEKVIERVRVYDRVKLGPGNYAPATWELWEKREVVGPEKKVEWTMIEKGSIGIGVIALVPFITGRRKGSSWRFYPPTQGIASLQINHFQQESNLEAAKEGACFPILAGNGVEPDMEDDGETVKELEVGAGSVLYGGITDGVPGSWVFIEPSSESLKFLASEIETCERQMRELGRQPLTNESGNLTVVTTAFAASKGNSAIQAWVNQLEDAAERALELTALWLNDTSEPEVIIYKDFSIDLETDQAPTMLKFLRENRDISREAILREAKRRDWVSPEFDAAVDKTALDKEPPPASPSNTPPSNPQRGVVQ